MAQSALRHPKMGSLFEVCRKNPLWDILQNCADFGAKWTIVVHSGAKSLQTWTNCDLEWTIAMKNHCRESCAAAQLIGKKQARCNKCLQLIYKIQLAWLTMSRNACGWQMLIWIVFNVKRWGGAKRQRAKDFKPKLVKVICFSQSMQLWNWTPMPRNKMRHFTSSSYQ